MSKQLPKYVEVPQYIISVITSYGNEETFLSSSLNYEFACCLGKWSVGVIEKLDSSSVKMSLDHLFNLVSELKVYKLKCFVTKTSELTKDDLTLIHHLVDPNKELFNSVFGGLV